MYENLPPVMYLGQVANPDHFLVYVQFDVPNDGYVPMTPKEMGDAAWTLYHEWLVRIGTVSMTTARQTYYPGGYGICLYGPRLNFTRGMYPPAGAAGVAVSRWMDPRDQWDMTPVWVDHHRVGKTKEARAAAMAHEIWHGLGWQHSDGMDLLQAGNLAKVKAGATKAALMARPARLQSASVGIRRAEDSSWTLCGAVDLVPRGA